MSKKINTAIVMGSHNDYSKSTYKRRLKILNLIDNRKYFFCNFHAKKHFDIKYPRLDLVEYFDETSWNRAYKSLDKIITMYNIQELIVYFTPLLGSIYRGMEEKVRRQYEKTLKNDNMQVTMNMMREYLRKSMLIHKLSSIMPTIHFIEDPLEMDCSVYNPANKEYYFYNREDKNLIHFPFVEYGDIYDFYIPENTQKLYDITIGMSSNANYWKERSLLVQEHKNTINDSNLKYKLFIKDKWIPDPEDRFVDKDTYDNFILQSKYTCVIPSYDRTEFSLIRFLEALHRNCIPLIHESCNIDWAFNHMPEIKKMLILYNKDNLIEIIQKTDYEKTLKRYKNTNDWQRLKDINYYHERCKTMEKQK